MDEVSKGPEVIKIVRRPGEARPALVARAEQEAFEAAAAAKRAAKRAKSRAGAAKVAQQAKAARRKAKAARAADFKAEVDARAFHAAKPAADAARNALLKVRAENAELRALLLGVTPPATNGPTEDRTLEKWEAGDRRNSFLSIARGAARPYPSLAHANGNATPEERRKSLAAERKELADMEAARFKAASDRRKALAEKSTAMDAADLAAVEARRATEAAAKAEVDRKILMAKTAARDERDAREAAVKAMIDEANEDEAKAMLASLQAQAKMLREALAAKKAAAAAK